MIGVSCRNPCPIVLSKKKVPKPMMEAAASAAGFMLPRVLPCVVSWDLLTLARSFRRLSWDKMKLLG